MKFLTKIFGDANERYTRSLKPIVDAINAWEEEFKGLTDEQLKAKTAEFKKRVAENESLDDILPEAFAAVREASRRTIKQRHFDVQLIGGIVLHQGKIAEMKTGEGKTLVATLSLYLNSLTGRGAHLVTPNDYLSRVGAGWMGPIYEALGVSIGVISQDFSGLYDSSFKDTHEHGDERLNHFRPVMRPQAYAADITYGTNNEFGFDYLRDNLEYLPSQMRQRDHYYAIVDEIDSILIDEARTPLIISAPDEESADLYQVFARIVPTLTKDTDYTVDEKMKTVSITEAGIDKVEATLEIDNIYEEKGIRFVRHLESALRAHTLFQRDKDYVVTDGQVIIVDEFTGRLMPGRRWSEGLHQAVEAKERVSIQQESRTLATITFQNFFRMYEKLGGMTGTAQTSAEEFHKVYDLEVITIPTHRPVVRKDSMDLVYRTEKGKFQAVVAEIKERQTKGQPVLVGTVSIEKNEYLSRMLEVAGVPHQVLNAKNHEREAMIIAQAGRLGAVTIATNMAGRGVDILLAGNPPDAAEAAKVRELGGLHVIGTERHEARRIDDQLRGRAGRQGDPGSSDFLVSLEDDVMRIFGSERVRNLMQTLGVPEDQAIENRMVSRAIESAQQKIEGFHFDARKHVLEYDDVLNKQRDAIYRLRKEILFAEQPTTNNQQPTDEDNSERTKAKTPKERILEMIEETIVQVVDIHTPSDGEWNMEEIFKIVQGIANVSSDLHTQLVEIEKSNQNDSAKRSALADAIISVLEKHYNEREERIGAEGSRNIERAVLLRSMDMLWMDHLDQMNYLRDTVRLRAYGQLDPLVEYKNEGRRMFHALNEAIRWEVVNNIFKIAGVPQEEKPKNIQEGRAQDMTFGLTPQDVAAATSAVSTTISNRGRGGGRSTSTTSQAANSNDPYPGTKRNDPCPCGAKTRAGTPKKYKNCHGRNM